MSAGNKDDIFKKIHAKLLITKVQRAKRILKEKDSTMFPTRKTL